VTDAINYIREIEDDMVAQLEPLSGEGVFVTSQPETASTSPQIQVRARLYVAYVGSEYQAPKMPRSDVTQNRTLRFQLSLYYRDLRTHQEVSRIEQLILSLLTNYQPDDCQRGRLYPTASRLITQDADGFWRFDIGFAMQVDHPLGE
jgi:Gp37 protein